MLKAVNNALLILLNVQVVLSFLIISSTSYFYQFIKLKSTEAPHSANWLLRCNSRWICKLSSFLFPLHG